MKALMSAFVAPRKRRCRRPTTDRHRKAHWLTLEGVQISKRGQHWQNIGSVHVAVAVEISAQDRRERQARQAAAAHHASGGQQRHSALVETPRAEGGVRGQGVARKYRGRGKGVEVGMEGHRPSRQGREEGGGIDVDINGIHAGESDVNPAERAKIRGIINRDLVAPRSDNGRRSVQAAQQYS